MKKLLKKALLWFMQSSIYTYLVKNVIPYIRFTTYYTSLRGWKYQRGYKILQPGDILLTLDRKKLTTLIIPGEVSHAALCVDKDCEWEISEMTHTDYTHSTFFDLCKESDRVLILRCKDWDDIYTQSVIDRCRSFDGVSYDVAFQMGVKTLYCSELVYESDHERRLQVSTEDLAGVGTPYISPAGLLHAENCDIVWDSDLEEQVTV